MNAHVGTGRLPGFFPTPALPPSAEPGPGDSSTLTDQDLLVQANQAVTNALAARAQADQSIDTSELAVVRLLALGLLNNFGRLGGVDTNNWMPVIVPCSTPGAVTIASSPPACVKGYTSLARGLADLIDTLYTTGLLYPVMALDENGNVALDGDGHPILSNVIESDLIASRTFGIPGLSWASPTPTMQEWLDHKERVRKAVVDALAFLGSQNYAVVPGSYTPSGLIDTFPTGGTTTAQYLPSEDKARVAEAAALLADAWPTSALPAGVDPIVAGQIGLQSLLTVLRSLSNFGQIGLSPNTQETNNWLLTGAPLDPTSFCPAGTLPSLEVKRCVYLLANPTQSASNVLLQLSLAGGYLPQALYTGDVGQLAYALYKDGYLPGLTEAAWKQKVAELKDTSAFIATTIGQSNRLRETGWKASDFTPPTGLPTGSPTSTGPVPSGAPTGSGTDGKSNETVEKETTNWKPYAIWGGVALLTFGGFYLLSRHKDPWEQESDAERERRASYDGDLSY